MKRVPLAVALCVPLWVHAFRDVALQVFSAQHFGFRISDGVAGEIAWGDVAGAGLALIALWLLRRDSRAAIPVDRRRYRPRLPELGQTAITSSTCSVPPRATNGCDLRISAAPSRLVASMSE
jgi:hypothetical protein